jgi:hypothetical protein
MLPFLEPFITGKKTYLFQYRDPVSQNKKLWPLLGIPIPQHLYNKVRENKLKTPNTY